MTVSGQKELNTQFIFLPDSIELAQEDTMGLIPYNIDSMEFCDAADSLVRILIQKAYLSAAVDSCYMKKDTLISTIYTGPQYHISHLAINQKDQLMMRGSGLERLRISDQLFTDDYIQSIKQIAVTHLARRGYPFAEISLDSVIIKDNHIAAVLRVEPAQLITYDSIQILGNAQISHKYLEKTLNLELGQAYNNHDISKIRDHLNSSKFLQLRTNPLVTFLNEKAKLYLPLDKKNASKFDFIVGVLPRTINGVRNFTITGDFTAELVNELGAGEAIGLRFQRLRPETQDLELTVNYPFLFGMPFGIDGHFSLFRNTDDFLNLQAGFGLDYQLSPSDRLNAGWAYESSRLIEVDTAQLLARNTLPDRLDVNVTSARFSIDHNRLNYIFNPSSGWQARLQVNAGQKRIRPNTTITSLSSENVDFENAYDTLTLRTFQAELNLSASYYLPLADWGTFRIANRSAWKFNEERIYQNEFYRIGGYKLLRGFNEQSIFTPRYTVFTFELRLLLDQFSYISLPFVDLGWASIQNLDGETITDRPLGLGMGLNFGTPAGIFNISFAAGRRIEQGLNFNETKIHFGYVNLF